MGVGAGIGVGGGADGGGGGCSHVCGHSHSSVSTHSPLTPSWCERGRHCAHSRSVRRKQPNPKASTQQCEARHPSKCADGSAWQCGRHGGGGGGGDGGDGSAGTGVGGGGGTSHVLGQSQSAVSTQWPSASRCRVRGRHMAKCLFALWKHSKRWASRQQRLSRQEEKCSDGAAAHRCQCVLAVGRGGVPGKGGGAGGAGSDGAGGGRCHV